MLFRSPTGVSGWTLLDTATSGTMATRAWTKIADAGDAGRRATVTLDAAAKYTMTVAAWSGVRTGSLVFADVADLGRLVPADAPHQGLVAEVDPLEDVWLGDLLMQGADDRRPLVVLDQVTDPHNVGAILRSAAAFGAAAVIVTDRHAPADTGVLAKSASGALEIVPLMRAVNLARTMEQLKEAGFWLYGLDERGDAPIGSLDLAGRVCIVLGAEGEGLRRLTAEKCDRLVTIPTNAALAALNVSNAAAVAAYEWARRRL